MRRSIAHAACFSVAGAILLAGCGEQSRLDADDVLNKASALQKPKPGLYTSTTAMTDFNVPGLPPAQADRFRAQMSDVASEAQPYCLTEAEAEKGFEDLLKSIGEGANGQSCTFTRFDVDAPALTAEMGCSGAAGSKMEIGFSGETTAESLDLTMDMKAKAASIPGGSMELSFTVKSQRIGECSAQDLAAAEERLKGVATGE